MKLACTQSDLSTHLSLVSRAVPSRPAHPVLANVKLTADEATQRVSLTAFDLSLGIRTSFAAKIEAGGEITLPAKLLGDIVARLPDGEMVLDDDLGEATVTIKSASGKYQVRGMGAEEFPELPIIEEGDVAQLPAEALIEGLKGALFAASTDETKQVLTGVHVTIQAEGLEFAATDGHRLAVVQTSSEEGAATIVGGEGTLDVTIPGKTLRELERMLAAHQSTEAIALRSEPGQVVFEWADQRLTSRLLEGQYPNYRQLIPKQFARQVTVERRSLISALERIAVLADRKNNIVKISLDSAQQQITVSVDAQDVGSGQEAVPAQLTGEDLDIAFNVKYLLDGLKVLPSTEVQIQVNTATSPVVLVPIGAMKMTYLVMPVQIRS
ncbi:DNA polymerase III subunit beta [Geitlerinema sp. PCC 7407]|uniref:DNA polymerase III subunit beta n=1 Tax=Geitlerinema sp. PCC 7407 TaxID=1173025 RepID=UPI00029FCB45|nr:DNA polymerase III subunit beta [Geitlerinema sp. PCC 7407]AFY66992.1 DNA polymerase III, beta subunit [Geitlerinema sp. PCC 7407]